MDFIEQLFGLSPDYGDGSTEILWLSVLAILFMAAIWWKRSGRVALARFPARHRLPRFTCDIRTTIRDQELVIVTGDTEIADPRQLVGSTIEIDGVRYLVVDSSSMATAVAPGQPIMLRVERH